MKKESQVELINFCLEKIEKVFNHGPYSEWTHQDYLTLSEEIRKFQMLLSVIPPP